MSTDISGVTRTLLTLLEQELESITGAAIAPTAAPPDQNASGSNIISAYLYHVLENPELKNAPPVMGSSLVPVRQAPMGLILQYVVTAIHTSAELDTDNLQREQELLGYVARTIHDFPRIKPDLMMGGDFVLDSALRDQNNSIEFILRPAPSDESINFWGSAEQQRVARLSLFVEARVVVLEPKPPTIIPGIVLSVGGFVFPDGGPQLVSSRTKVHFPVPEIASSDLQSIDFDPARASLFPDDTSSLSGPLAPLLANNRVTLTTLGLGVKKRSLVLKRDDAEVRIALDPVHADNSLWDFNVLAARVEFSANINVTAFVDGAATATPTNLAPGNYRARVVIDDERMGGKRRTSNEITLVFMPQVLSAGPEGTAGRYQIQVLGDYLSVGGDISLGAGGEFLTETETSGVFGPGVFEVTGPGTIDFELPSGVAVPSPTNPVALNLVVNGATATPSWLTTEAI